MVEVIEEPIDVVASFRRGLMRPALFTWQKRRYNVRAITLAWKENDGQFRRYYFAVVPAGPDGDMRDLYELVFSTRDLTWRLLKVYSPD